MEKNEQTLKPRIYTVGTSHLDTSWNWTLETTIRDYISKTLLENFERFEKYPEYVFSFEGAYRYELMEEYYPEEFKRLKQYVAAGRWNVTGSSYENGDVNVPSPESLFRNILYGNNYFDENSASAVRISSCRTALDSAMRCPPSPTTPTCSALRHRS